MWAGFSFFNGTLGSLVGLSALALGLASLPIYMVSRALKTPADRERARRLTLHSKGRMGDATVTDVRDDLLLYSYSVRGVEYSASQDVSKLAELLPEDRSTLIGAATIKYHPANPANSMVVCEFWSGLRQPPRSGFNTQGLAS